MSPIPFSTPTFIMSPDLPIMPASLIPSPTTPSSPSPSAPENYIKPQTNHSILILFVSVASVIGLSALLVCGWCYLKKRKADDKEAASDPDGNDAKVWEPGENVYSNTEKAFESDTASADKTFVIGDCDSDVEDSKPVDDDTKNTEHSEEDTVYESKDDPEELSFTILEGFDTSFADSVENGLDVASLFSDEDRASINSYISDTKCMSSTNWLAIEQAVADRTSFVRQSFTVVEHVQLADISLNAQIMHVPGQAEIVGAPEPSNSKPGFDKISQNDEMQSIFAEINALEELYSSDGMSSEESSAVSDSAGDSKDIGCSAADMVCVHSSHTIPQDISKPPTVSRLSIAPKAAPSLHKAHGDSQIDEMQSIFAEIDALEELYSSDGMSSDESSIMSPTLLSSTGDRKDMGYSTTRHPDMDISQPSAVSSPSIAPKPTPSAHRYSSDFRRSASSLSASSDSSDDYMPLPLVRPLNIKKKKPLTSTPVPAVHATTPSERHTQIFKFPDQASLCQGVLEDSLVSPHGSALGHKTDPQRADGVEQFDAHVKVIPTPISPRDDGDSSLPSLMDDSNTSSSSTNTSYSYEDRERVAIANWSTLLDSSMRTDDFDPFDNFCTTRNSRLALKGKGRAPCTAIRSPPRIFSRFPKGDEDPADISTCSFVFDALMDSVIVDFAPIVEDIQHATNQAANIKSTSRDIRQQMPDVGNNTTPAKQGLAPENERSCQPVVYDPVAINLVANKQATQDINAPIVVSSGHPSPPLKATISPDATALSTVTIHEENTQRTPIAILGNNINLNTMPVKHLPSINKRSPPAYNFGAIDLVANNQETLELIKTHTPSPLDHPPIPVSAITLLHTNTPLTTIREDTQTSPIMSTTTNNVPPLTLPIKQGISPNNKRRTSIPITGLINDTGRSHIPGFSQSSHPPSTRTLAPSSAPSIAVVPSTTTITRVLSPKSDRRRTTPFARHARNAQQPHFAKPIEQAPTRPGTPKKRADPTRPPVSRTLSLATTAAPKHSTPKPAFRARSRTIVAPRESPGKSEPCEQQGGEFIALADGIALAKRSLTSNKPRPGLLFSSTPQRAPPTASSGFATGSPALRSRLRADDPKDAPISTPSKTITRTSSARSARLVSPSSSVRSVRSISSVPSALKDLGAAHAIARSEKQPVSSLAQTRSPSLLSGSVSRLSRSPLVSCLPPDSPRAHRRSITKGPRKSLHTITEDAPENSATLVEREKGKHVVVGGRFSREFRPLSTVETNFPSDNNSAQRELLDRITEDAPENRDKFVEREKGKKLVIDGRFSKEFRPLSTVLTKSPSDNKGSHHEVLHTIAEDASENSNTFVEREKGKNSVVDRRFSREFRSPSTVVTKFPSDNKFTHTPAQGPRFVGGLRGRPSPRSISIWQ